jgi:integrase
MPRRTRGKGEGTISLRADGRWYARLDMGWVNGKRKRPGFYGTTRKEVADQLNDAQSKRRRNLPISFERQTVAQYLTKWLESARPSVRPRTYERFEGLVRMHLVPTLGTIRLDRLTPQQVQQLLTAKSASGLAPQSVRHIRTVLSIALGRALKNREGRSRTRISRASMRACARNV